MSLKRRIYSGFCIQEIINFQDCREIPAFTVCDTPFECRKSRQFSIDVFYFVGVSFTVFFTLCSGIEASSVPECDFLIEGYDFPVLFALVNPYYDTFYRAHLVVISDSPSCSSGFLLDDYLALGFHVSCRN